MKRRGEGREGGERREKAREGEGEEEKGGEGGINDVLIACLMSGHQKHLNTSIRTTTMSSRK